MRRREFIKSVVALGGASALGQGAAFAYDYLPTPNLKVKRVLAMFKCHFDAGFIDTQKAVVGWYFNDYFPQAIRVARNMRLSGGHKYVWTTGSWLLYEYLEQASPADRREMEQAIADGDIAWHAIPFNWQTEMMDRSMIAGSLALSQQLDRRFGRTTTGAKMTDVPGHTRGLIAPLAAAGVTFLDIGCNGGTVVADVPPLFLWKDSTGADLTVMYHNGYGALMVVPGSDLAISINVRTDNSGPDTPNEIVSLYSELSDRFPNAEIVATSLTEIANAVAHYRSRLPVVTQEIGDSWIFGVSSDPLKTARYREVARLRERWISEGEIRVGDAVDIALLRGVLLEAEHTWGTDTKTWLDFDHYTPRDLAKMLDTKNYKVVEFSWQEKRQDLLDGVGTLPAHLRTQADDAIRGLAATEPTAGRGVVHPAEKEIDGKHFIVKVDAKTGAITRLCDKKTEREWASADHPIALFSYQTLSQQDYSRVFANYIITKAEWINFDFGKPNIERFGAESRSWAPTLVSLHSEETAEGIRVLAQLEIRDAVAIESGRAAFPQRMYMELVLPQDEPVVKLNFSWFEKTATRLPEAMWLTFHPVAPEERGWMMEKSGEEVSPFDVVAGGSRHMHAVGKNFSYKDKSGAFSVEPLDAALFAVGGKSPLNFSKTQPDLSEGIHCNLFNNAWGTNYIMWFGEDMRFRFVLRT
jgi:hypothetical protein